MPFWLHEHWALRAFKGITAAHKALAFISVAVCAVGMWLLWVYGPLLHQLQQKRKELKNLEQQQQVADTAIAGYSAACKRHKKLCLQYPCLVQTPSLQHLLNFFLTSLHEHNVSCCSLVPGEVNTTSTETAYNFKLVALGDFYDVHRMFEWFGKFEQSIIFNSVDIVSQENDCVRLEAVLSVQQLKKEYLDHV